MSLPPNRPDREQQKFFEDDNGNTAVNIGVTPSSPLPTTPNISNKFRVREDGSNVALGTGDTTLFTYSGSGLFYGFSIGFSNHTDITVKLEIDAVTIWDLAFDDIAESQTIAPGDTGAIHFGAAWGPMYNSKNSMLLFVPPGPIPYATSITISGRRAPGGGQPRQKLAQFITLTEET
jgi:hypothetical protein